MGWWHIAIGSNIPITLNYRSSPRIPLCRLVSAAVSVGVLSLFGFVWVDPFGIYLLGYIGVGLSISRSQDEVSYLNINLCAFGQGIKCWTSEDLYNKYILKTGKTVQCAVGENHFSRLIQPQFRLSLNSLISSSLHNTCGFLSRTQDSKSLCCYNIIVWGVSSLEVS